jgi:hypothetical protein
MRILHAFAVVFFTFFPDLATAQTFAGIGSRAEGMAGAFVAVADDASAILWNPAGLATGALFDTQVYGDSGSNRLLAVAIPSVGLSYYRLHTVSGSGSRKNEGSGEVRPGTLTTNNFGVTLLQTVVKGLVIGSTMRIVSGGFDDFQGRTTFDLDAGAMLATGSVRFGVTARNLRQAEFLDREALIPTERAARVGVAYVPRSSAYGANGPFSVSLDADLTRSLTGTEKTRGVAIGGEYWVPKGIVGGRAGVRWNTLKAGNRVVSGGFSVKFPYGLFAEGHVTKAEGSEDFQWGLGGRVAF